MRYRIVLPIDEIIKDYKSGVSSRALGKQYRVSKSTILDRLKEHDVIRKAKNEKKHHLKIDLPIDEIIKDYQSGVSSYELGEWYGVCSKTILNRIRDYGANVRSPHLKMDLPMEEIIKDYESGMTTYELVVKYEVSISTLKRRFKERGINVRSPYKKMGLPIDEIIKDYQSGMTIYELSEWYGASTWTIRERLNKAGVKRRGRHG